MTQFSVWRNIPPFPPMVAGTTATKGHVSLSDTGDLPRSPALAEGLTGAETMNFIQQQHGYDFEPTASIDADRAAVRAINAAHTAFVTTVKAQIATLECNESKRLLSDLVMHLGDVYTDDICPALAKLDAALDENENGMTYADMRREWAQRVL